MAMSEAARKARAQYMREWRAKNKDRCKTYKGTYWQKKADEMKQKEEVKKDE